MSVTNAATHADMEMTYTITVSVICLPSQIAQMGSKAAASDRFQDVLGLWLRLVSAAMLAQFLAVRCGLTRATESSWFFYDPPPVLPAIKARFSQYSARSISPRA